MTDDQLADRFAAAELPAWENDEAFEQLLLSFESILPLRRPLGFPRSESLSTDSQPDPGRAGSCLPSDGNRGRRSDSFR
jgi:hypothetical protein